MRKLFVVASAIIILALAMAVPAAAVMLGQPDGNGHPLCWQRRVLRFVRIAAVALLGNIAVLDSFSYRRPLHVRRGQSPGMVYTQMPRPPYPFGGGVTGTPHAHPAFGASFPNTSDVGVVILDSPVVQSTYGVLPALGTLDSLASKRGQQDVTFKIVAYGLQGAKPTLLQATERYIGYTKLNNLKNSLTGGYNIQLSSNPGNWSGGLCFGDSGGPVFLGNTNIVVAVNSFVLNSNCRGNGFSYRTDIANSQNFIHTYLP